MIGILTLIFVIALSMLITKVATIALTHTGMERERAKFQARSAFTGAGFTTSESEMVVKHPMRRKIIMMLLLMGNAGLVTAISSLIISFTGAHSARNQMLNVYLLLTGIFLLFLSTRSKRLDRLMDKIIVKLLVKFTDIRPKSFARMMTIMDDYEVMEVEAAGNSWLTGSTLAELKLTEEGLLVLGVIQKGEHYNGVPRGNYRVQPEDRLVMYGRAEQIAEMSTRRDKLQGRMEHQQSKQEFEERLREQEKEAESREREGPHPA